MDKILKKVLQRITPTRAEAQKELAFAEKTIKKIGLMKGGHVRAELVGSIARGTHLRGDNDLDIFVFYPEHMERSEFERAGLAAGKAVFRGHKYEKAYSEHPYLRGKIGGYEVEIVPAYDIKSAEGRKSAVDRSSLHNKYLIAHYKEGQRSEARLLKQFMKGVKCYGADLSANGFPGYVAEQLIIKYGNFIGAVKAAADWKHGEVVDTEGYWEPEDARKKFNSHFILVDPVDRNRNVAAALSANQCTRFIAACRAFAKRPSTSFFFPKPHKAWSRAKLLAFLKKTELVAAELGYPKGIVEDVVWGQLRRFGRKIAGFCRGADFIVKRSDEWLEHGKRMVILLEVESTELQKAKILRGPEATDKANSEAFIKAHPKPLAGPRIEDGRWVLEVERTDTNLEKFLQKVLGRMKREEKGGIRTALKKRAKVLGEKGIAALYAKSKGFRQFLTGYLKGEEGFLDY